MGIPTVNRYDRHASCFAVQCDGDALDEVLAFEEQQGNIPIFMVLNTEDADWEFTLIFKHSPA